MTRRLSAHDLGRTAELRALNYLTDQGLKCVARNFRTRAGEIDLVMLDGAELVFVEVRRRADARFGDGFESVNATKRRRLVAAALRYLQIHAPDRPCRFDVVALDGRDSVRWLRNAFEAG